MHIGSIIWPALVLLSSLGLAACVGQEGRLEQPRDVPILERWAGDYPVEAIDRLPAGQREAGIGWLDPASFSPVWEVLYRGSAVPTVDFEHHLVVFVRNTEYYNRTNIFRVRLLDGVAEVLAMETMSAIPIQAHVAMALAVIPRAGIKALRLGETVVPIGG